MIAVTRNDSRVLLLLLQAAEPSSSWEINEALQLPVGSLLMLLPQTEDDDERARSLQKASPVPLPSWSSCDVPPSHCLLLERIAQSCPYTPMQLQRAMAAAAAAGFPEVSIFPPHPMQC
jgi:hypothetical protein